MEQFCKDKNNSYTSKISARNELTQLLGTNLVLVKRREKKEFCSILRNHKIRRNMILLLKTDKQEFILNDQSNLKRIRFLSLLIMNWTWRETKFSAMITQLLLSVKANRGKNLFSFFSFQLKWRFRKKEENSCAWLKYVYFQCDAKMNFSHETFLKNENQ